MITAIRQAVITGKRAAASNEQLLKVASRDYYYQQVLLTGVLPVRVRCRAFDRGWLAQRRAMATIRG